MSASSKKKLRKEQEAAKMTEKQLAAQREAKKLNLYTTIFVVVLVALLVVAATVGAYQAITNSGLREKNTTAVTVGSQEISNAELNYFYMDAVNTFYSQYGSYASLFGLDPSLPLNEQVVDETTGKTWADDFLDSAKQTAAAAYAMKAAAETEGFALTAEQVASIETEMESLELYATMYGYRDAESYLKAFYGNGANVKSYTEYTKLRTLAQEYQVHHADSLVYTNEDLRAAEADNYDAYSSFTYHAYYVTASKYLTGGTTDAEGSTTYTEEETAASVAAAEEAAKALVAEEIDSVEDLDAAIAAMPVNAGLSSASTAYEDTLFSSINAAYAEWVADDSRTEGDKAYFANTSTTTAEDGTETTVTNGYYVVYFLGANDNQFPLTNIRHILITPEHSHEEGEEHTDGETYSEEELAAAKATAQEILDQWKAGEATEESFAALANEKSADGDGTTGGLYENVYPGQMVEPFEDWCFDSSRKTGDTGIVESSYGYHVMYFVGESEQTYRDYQIETELRNADLNAWYEETVDAMSITDGDCKFIRTDLVLNPTEAAE